MYRLVVFDVDGTLVDDTVYIWNTIHDHLKTSVDKRNCAKRKFKNREITYEEWMAHDMMLWRDAGVTKEKVLEAISPLRLMPGALDTVMQLKDEGYVLAVVSGSISLVLDSLIPNYGWIFSDVLINHVYFDEKGMLSGWNASRFDMEGKADGLRMISAKHGFSLDECVFVGDNKNDLYIAEAAGLSIAFNCKSNRLAEISDVVIKEKDLKAVLPYIR